MAKDPELQVHVEWLGFLQPIGLVVSPPALVSAGAFPNKNIIPEHARYLEVVEQVTVERQIDPQPAIRDFPRFATSILGWEPADLLGSLDIEPVPATLEVTLPEYNETLRPTYAVPDVDKTPEGSRKWLMLVQRVTLGLDLDETPDTDSKDHRWQASPQARFERLLRETQVPIGLLSNGTHLRLVYAPRGESSGHLTFPVKAMTEVAGRPIFAALQMLLSAQRLFTLPDKERLPFILAESRKYQSLVSTKLAEQVLAALYELLRGFQAADDQRHGELLGDVLNDDPDHVYGGLLRVLLRLVFILYAEDRSLLSNDEVYQKFYSVIGLFERLREDAGRYTDTMDHRYGAWAQLLTLFRLIYDGGRHGSMKLLARKGYLFYPDQYPFLEGRRRGVVSSSLLVPGQEVPAAISDPAPANQEPRTNNQQLPRVSDGVVFRVLQNLLILDGERLSYRTLDVEQIGSVYETIMGFSLEVAQGRSIAIKPTKPHGAPTTINLDELLAAKPADRARWLKDKTDQSLSGQAAAVLKQATTPEAAIAALDRKVAFSATPRVVPAGAMVLQPSDERRRSGSHYTPRTLTEPIVETTFRPILERLLVTGSQLLEKGNLGLMAAPSDARTKPPTTAPSDPRTNNQQPRTTPTPERILDLKVCDPAMGSGAFLVAACRQLAEQLVKAWHAHDRVPKDIPPDEDEILHACRLVAQRCLYGVDKNPMAVDLAKLSLWLATLARDHPFTFLDHALKCGDSLVGLTKDQILGFHWKPEKQRDFARAAIEGQLNRALEQRRQIREAPDGTSELLLRERLQAADGFLDAGRRYGDLVIAAFFAADNDRKRKERLESLAADLAAQRTQFDAARQEHIEAAANGLRSGPHAVAPFHWEIEFPEVFQRENAGFDGFVGNPPFAGKNTMAAGHAAGYLDWLKTIHEESHGNSDLVAHFFRRTFNLLRNDGALGLIATNTVGQGDTRSTGLRWICENGGKIYSARKRYRWPGQAAVVVSIIHVAKGDIRGQLLVDGRARPDITSYLFHAGGNEEPARLTSNKGKCFQGTTILGMGFTFDDTDTQGVATPVKEMRRLLDQDARNAERIFPYIGGEEINTSPNHAYHRYVIDFAEMTEDEARRWPDLFAIVEAKVKGTRGAYATSEFWQFERSRRELYTAIRHLPRVLLTNAQAAPHHALAFYSNGNIFANSLNVFALSDWFHFAVLQSLIHELWARFFSSSMKDDLRYNPTDCFETFPFPEKVKMDQQFEEVGKEYYEFRAGLMVRNNEGLTKTYNRFHDPDERSADILKLRELHSSMDRLVLDAYGWTDLKPTWEFLLDYQEDEDEDESGTGRRRKKPWRYRWPDDFRDEVLARLLELNRQRAKEERLSGAAANAKKQTRKTAGQKSDPRQKGFF
jgi:hypothetical protein